MFAVVKLEIFWPSCFALSWELIAASLKVLLNVAQKFLGLSVFPAMLHVDLCEMGWIRPGELLYPVAHEQLLAFWLLRRSQITRLTLNFNLQPWSAAAGWAGRPYYIWRWFWVGFEIFYFLNHRTFQEEPLGFFQVGKDFWFVFVPLSLDDGFPAGRKPWNDAIYRWGVLANWTSLK